MWFKKAKERSRQPSIPGAIPVTRYYTASPSAKKLGANDQKDRQRQTSVPKTRRLSLSTILPVVCAGSVLIFLLLLLGSPSIKFTDGSVLYKDKEAYVEKISTLVSNSVFNKSKITIQSEKLEDAIKAAFPEVSDVSVVVPFIGQRLQIGIQTKTPTLLLVQPNGQQGVIAEDGTIAAITDDMPELPVVSITPQAVLQPKESVLTSQEVAFLRLIADELAAERDFPVPTIEKTTLLVESNELLVSFRNAPYAARLQTQGYERNQIAALLSVIKSFSQGGVEEPKEYIDVRVPGRVFVK